MHCKLDILDCFIANGYIVTQEFECICMLLHMDIKGGGVGVVVQWVLAIRPLAGRTLEQEMIPFRDGFKSWSKQW